MKSFKKNPSYNKFVNDRNKALEQLHINSQVRVSNILHEALTHILQICSHRYSMIGQDSFFTDQARQVLKQIDSQIDATLSHACKSITIEFVRLRRYVYMLTTAGETEAIGRALGRYTQFRIDRAKLDKVSTSKLRQDEDVMQRVSFELTKLKHKVMQALEYSRVVEEPHAEMLQRVEKAFPKSYVYKKPPRILKSIKEAGSKKEDKEASVIFVDDQEWEQMVSDYLEGPQFLPERFYNEEELIYVDGEQALKGYAWQIEQQLTDDFVQQVRDGQVEAANENGISDFVWIAILDDKTDECCEWRNGLTTSEIEAELESNRADDECDAITPPAHFNCRCDLAPVGDDIPDRVETDFGEFSDWITS